MYHIRCRKKNRYQNEMYRLQKASPRNNKCHSTVDARVPLTLTEIHSPHNIPLKLKNKIAANFIKRDSSAFRNSLLGINALSCVRNYIFSGI